MNVYFIMVKTKNDLEINLDEIDCNSVVFITGHIDDMWEVAFLQKLSILSQECVQRNIEIFFVPGAYSDTKNLNFIIKYEASCLKITDNIYTMINLETMYIKDYTVTALDYTISIEKDSVYEFDIHYKS